MTAQHFSGCDQLDKVGKKLHELAQIHHPDLGGDLRTMQDITMQYTWIRSASKRDTRTWYGAYLAKFPEVEASSEYRYDYQNDARDAAAEAEAEAAWEKIWMETLIDLGLIPGISVEIFGTWIWVGGLTYPVRNQLYELGLNWSARKRMWYFAGAEGNPKSHNRYTMEQIRAKYGSTRVKDE
jgi:hypothetical protein